MRFIQKNQVMATLIVAITIVGVCTYPAVSRGGDETQEVRASLDDLYAWLGDTQKGRAWNNFLKSSELESLLVQGDAADEAAVAAILDLYESKTPGLSKRPFMRVRTALQSWSEDLSLLTVEELSTAIQEAKAEFDDIDDQQVKRSKTALVAALNRLESYLNRGGTTTSSGWKAFLKWELLEQELDKEERPDDKVLEEVTNRYFADQDGLQKEHFLEVRTALRKYLDMIIFSAEGIVAQYEAQLDSLSTALEAYTDSKSHESSAGVAYPLGWLARAEQASDIVAAVRHHYAKKNLYAQVSEELFAVGINEDIDRTAPHTDNILGTSIQGTGHFRGKVVANLIPSSDKGLFETRLVGVVNSNNTGYNRSVVIYSTGRTTVDGRKRITFDTDGMSGSPATARCTTSSKVHTVEASSDLVRQIAWKKIGESKSEAEQIASQHAEQRVAEQMDREANKMIVDSNKRLNEKVRDPLVRRGQTPAEMNFRTTEDHMFASLLHANAFQLGAFSDPPSLNEGHDLAVRMHESTINNYAESLIGGTTLTDEEAAEMAKGLNNDVVPDKLQIGPEDDPWSITFTRVRPITIVFEEGLVTVTIRGRRFTSGDRTLQAMNITAIYAAELHGIGAKLTRQGDIEILPADFASRERKTLSAAETAARAIVSRKFENLFKAEIVSDGLQLPDRWKDAGDLALKQLNLGGGWMTLGWMMPSNEVHTADASTP